MKPIYPISFSAYALGFWLVWRYAPEPASRVSNGFHPLALLGGILELVSGLILLVILAESYTRWAMLKPREVQGLLLAAWLIMLVPAALLYQYSWMTYGQRMAPMGSSLRFYLATPWPIALAICLVGTWLTFRGWKETKTRG